VTPADGSEVARPRTAWWRGLALLLVLCVVLGLVGGLVWYLVAPTPAFLVEGGQLMYRKELPGEYVAMDGWFAVIGAVAGLLVAVVVLRRGPLTMARVVAVPLAGLLGAWVMWRLGAALAPASSGLNADAGSLPSGTVLHGKLDLNAKGVLLIWPVVSLLVLTFALAFSGRAEPEPAQHQPADDGGALVGGDADLRDIDRG